MPTLDWIGKSAVVNHHKAVPYRLVKCDKELSAGEAGEGNLLVEGDNLHALKALLPYYGGKVKCIYIDPPYNTGNEGWIYNDNVNAPEIKRWLGQVVGKEAEDLSRHDKWLCMMYPRLVLLREFLREDGAIFISIDDNEVANIRVILDEIFGAKNFVATFIWEKRTTRENRRVFSFKHDFVVCYARAKGRFEAVRGTLPLTDEVKGRFENPDDDPRGVWQSVSLNAQAGHATPSQFYTITTPGGRKLDPPPGRCWSVTAERLEELIADNRIWFGKSGNNAPRLKKFLGEARQGLVPQTIWTAEECGTTDSATKLLFTIFGGDAGFNTTPKPPELIDRILRVATKPGELVLDSFGGSGTTGHAVLQLNKEDGGNRRFILVEMEQKISRDITAERMKRVIAGYGETPGLGGGFRYCTLAEPLFDERGQIAEAVKFADLAHHVFFTETGEPMPKRPDKRTPLLGVHNGRAIYLLFNGILDDKQPRSGNVLTNDVLKLLPPHTGPRVIYGTACRLSANRLKREGITFRQIPYEIKTD